MTAPNNRERILPRLIDEEMKDSFINYSMSVIVSRALPDVRDGLKPVHRRVLYAMNELGLVPGRPYKKSATVVGDVLGKYHPHGDSSVYDALVRMVQDFSLRHPLVDGQGNYGSIEGDPAAAYRYTEAKLTPIALELLADIEKDTVDFAPNFDDRLEEPTVLPAAFPNLLVNGSQGIAVGMATNIPPHNLREVHKAIQALVANPDTSVDELAKFIKGPDFPTGGFIQGKQGIHDYLRTGRGRIVMRAKAAIEERESSNKSQIVITEVPYQVNPAKVVEDIADLVREKKLEGISALRNESDKDGLRLVIECKRDAIPRVVLNQLYKHTQLQSTFGVIMLALVPDPQTRRLVPKELNIREVLVHYVEHRHEVIVRRAQFELQKAKDREHILEGLKVAVDNIDAVITLIRESADTEAASAQLQARFALSEKQAEAILNMRLAKLTGLEREKLEEELAEVRATIAGLEELLANKPKRMALLLEELAEVVRKYGDERRTEILADDGEMTIEDLIADEEMVVTVSHAGYIKRTSVATYRKQRRGGTGSSASGLRDDDFIEHLFIASTHSYLLVFCDDGRMFWLKVHAIPEGGKATKGKPIVNLINVSPETGISAILPVREFPDDQFLFFCSKNGTVKKTRLSEYGNVRAAGVKAVKVEDGDELMDVQITTGSNDVILATRDGLSIRFPETDVREMGRDTTGVKGITLGRDDAVVGMVVVKRTAALLVVTEKGMGKRTPVDEYRVQGRGGKGIITQDVTPKTGAVVSVLEVVPEDEVMLITKGGTAIRCPVGEIREIGRNTQGVRCINLDGDDRVTAVARVVSEEKDGVAGGEDVAPAGAGGDEADEG
jgi:DNA gyrase subunit A